jgi:hypothetical protein
VQRGAGTAWRTFSPRPAHAALQYDRDRLNAAAHQKSSSIMSRQLAIASTFSVLALSALALSAPVRTSDVGFWPKGAVIETAAPPLTAKLPFTG